MTDGTDLGGSCDGRFLAVREAFRENLLDRGELGAAVCVLLDGRPVVDLWGGWADAARTRPWERDTVVNAFSVGKGLAGLCALMLASRGQLALDDPICARWPAFAAGGKESVTARQVLSHRAGLAAIGEQLSPEALYRWEAVTAALAAQEPWWEPGAAHGYHVHTFGFLVGEVVRRAAGEGIGSFLRREVAEPLEADVGFGLPPRARGRRAEYVFDPAVIARREAGRRTPVDPTLRERAYMNPPGATGLETVNTDAWQDAVLPSANLHADARGIARVYGVLAAGGPPLIAREVLAQALTEASCGADLVLGRPSRFGLGFQLTQPERPLGPGAASFGHFGAGGSLGFADPERGVAFAYVMNRGGPGWQDPRNRALIDALYDALGV